MNLYKNIRIELKKIKSTASLQLALISGFFIPVIYFIYYLTKYTSLIPSEGVNPWEKFISEQFRNTAPFLLPILFILQTSLVAQIEHRVNGFKYIFTQPVQRWKVYLSKMMTVILVLLISFISFALLLYCSGSLVGSIHKELMFNEYPFPWVWVLSFLSTVFIANLGILSIQFWMSLRFKNFIVPIGIGMVLLVTGLIVYRAEESLYMPYSYSIHGMILATNDHSNWFPGQIGWYSLGVFMLFTTIGCWEITRKNIVD